MSDNSSQQGQEQIGDNLKNFREEKLFQSQIDCKTCKVILDQNHIFKTCKDTAQLRRNWSKFIYENGIDFDYFYDWLMYGEDYIIEMNKCVNQFKKKKYEQNAFKPRAK